MKERKKVIERKKEREREIIIRFGLRRSRFNREDETKQKQKGEGDEGMCRYSR